MAIEMELSSACCQSIVFFTDLDDGQANRTPSRNKASLLLRIGSLGNGHISLRCLIEQFTFKLARTNGTERRRPAASTYQQAEELITAAQHVITDLDYGAASSLTEQSARITSQLPSGMSPLSCSIKSIAPKSGRGPERCLGLRKIFASLTFRGKNHLS